MKYNILAIVKVMIINPTLVILGLRGMVINKFSHCGCAFKRCPSSRYGGFVAMVRYILQPSPQKLSTSLFLFRVSLYVVNWIISSSPSPFISQNGGQGRKVPYRDPAGKSISVLSLSNTSFAFDTRSCASYQPSFMPFPALFRAYLIKLARSTEKSTCRQRTRHWSQNPSFQSKR